VAGDTTMRHILAVVAAMSLAMPAALPSSLVFQDGGMGGSGGMGGAGGKGPDVPGGGPGPDNPDKPKGKDPKPSKPAELQAAPIVLRALLDETRPPETLKMALMKVAGAKEIKVSDTEASLLFTGSYLELNSLVKAASSVQIKSVLYDPALFVIEYAAGKNAQQKAAMDALQKVPGVQKVFMDGSKIVVAGPTKHIDARGFAPALQDAGFKFVALRSHRLRTLGYEPWEKETKAEKLRDRLLRVPGMLRVDMDYSASTVTVLQMLDTVKDLGLAAAAEEVCFALYPGKEEDPPPAPEPKK